MSAIIKNTKHENLPSILPPGMASKTVICFALWSKSTTVSYLAAWTVMKMAQWKASKMDV